MLLQFNRQSTSEDENTAKLHKSLGEPHIASFNFCVDAGLAAAVSKLEPVVFIRDDITARLYVKSARIEYPKLAAEFGCANKLLPKECRLRACTYSGSLILTIGWSINGKEEYQMDRKVGDIPIMVKSSRCYLENLNPDELVRAGEHAEEWGGYFIVKGHSRLIRMLAITRRNFPVALKRSTWKTRGKNFTEFGVIIRSVDDDDETAVINTLHHLNDGTLKLMITYKRNLFFLPLMLVLKSCCDVSDKYIYDCLLDNYNCDTSFKSYIKDMLGDLHVRNLHTHSQCLQYVGKMFRSGISELIDSRTDEEIGKFLLKHCVLLHAKKKEEKFKVLVFMAQKLMALVTGRCLLENIDAVMMHEILLGGHLYLQIIKEKIRTWLFIARLSMTKYMEAQPTKRAFSMGDLNTVLRTTPNVGSIIENFVATGNVRSEHGLTIPQESGLTIMTENINRMRYMSHFRAVHRGSYFQEMRTTEARQLLPDAWGFICPVHTPDGVPCGLLNHLTTACRITERPNTEQVDAIHIELSNCGMEPWMGLMTMMNDKLEDRRRQTYLIVMLNGIVLGVLRNELVANIVHHLRKLKVQGKVVPSTMEIVWVPLKSNVVEASAAQYPGLYLFTGPARMMRPVMNIALQAVEWIGSFEQVYLHVALDMRQTYPGVTTHVELSKEGFLSNLAQLIPMPDLNQSPRNMYQCQMGKQTMGTPCHNWQMQFDSKLYRLQTPAMPLFVPEHFKALRMQDFPMGTNAIIAVASYSGYDMEDALIINKCSDERGFAHGSIYKVQIVELEKTQFFGLDPKGAKLDEFLDADGLPYVGRKMKPKEPFYSFCDTDTAKYVVKHYSGKETCIIDNVRLCNSLKSNITHLACVTLRIPRNTGVGDKFASRAGQKGICSQKMPMIDMPVTETGIVPDIIFNPHGFPSRMTIAMMVEVMAGKCSSLGGHYFNASPFLFNESQTAVQYFGEVLKMNGYNYFGSELMYSGITGELLNSEIFFGIVHYQRLRHMVLDKWQVRSTGPIDAITRQPVKGRKRGGGVRFGEMERDGLISHGASILLNDRLLNGSDKLRILVCTKCRSILSPFTLEQAIGIRSRKPVTRTICKLCDDSSYISEIDAPYIYKCLLIELMSCNINVNVNCVRV